MGIISIEGLQFIPKRCFSDERGNVLKMIQEEDDILGAIKEIYLSTTHAGQVKAWKRHKRMLQHQTVATGEMEYVFYDDRPNSASKGQVNRLIVGPENNHGLVIIPPMVWYGFRCVSDRDAVIVNAASIGHAPEEIDRLHFDSDHIPFEWN